MKRGNILSLILVLVLIFSISLVTSAEYPEQNIRLVVAASAGGSTDSLARTLSPYLERELGTSIYVENLPGAGTEIGATAIAQAKPDGYTIGLNNLPNFNIIAAARDTNFDPVESYEAIGVNVKDPNVFLIRQEEDRFHDLNSLIEYIKAHPGEVIFGAQGPLSDDHVAIAKFMKSADVKITYIPYEGGNPAAQALLSGEVDVSVQNVYQAIKLEEQTKAVAVLHEERYHLIPDVPTYEELTGDLLVNSSTRGLIAPAGVPSERLEILRNAFRAAATNPEFLKEAKERGITTIDPILVGEEFKENMRNIEKDIQDILPLFREQGFID